MTSICLRFVQHGKRWFDGKKINQNFEEAKAEKFGYLYDDTLNSDDETDDETDNESWSYQVSFSAKLGFSHTIFDIKLQY